MLLLILHLHCIIRIMRPSSILTFQPRLEPGVPWGRDLFTFVTSAAGHMMRTLQKPRKNKPSKRQVNHRRFLHNMIQRKFAEIDAANHQLASGLVSADKPLAQLTLTQSSVESEVRDSSPKSPTKDDLAQKEDQCDLWRMGALMDTHLAEKRVPTCKTSYRKETILRKHPENSMEFHDIESFQDGEPFWFESSLSKPCLTNYTNKILVPKENEVPVLSPPSPVVSLLSLDSCDLEVQMLIDGEHCTQNHEHTAQESLKIDITDDFELLDSSEYPGDLEMHVSDADLTTHGADLLERIVFPDCVDSGFDLQCFTGPCRETNKYTLNLEHEPNSNSQCIQEPGCGLSQSHTNYLMNSSEYACTDTRHRMPGTNKGPSDTDIASLENIFCSSLNTFSLNRVLDEPWERQLLCDNSSCKNFSRSEKDGFYVMQDSNMVDSVNGLSDHCSIVCCPEGFCHEKDESCLYSTFKVNQIGHNFEGIARSFPAISPKKNPTPISPPLDNDWLFSNIVEEHVIDGTCNTIRKF